MEQLTINVDLKTDQAIQNTQTLVPLVTGLKNEATEMAGAVGKADKALDGMGQAAAQAGKQTTSAAHGLNDLAAASDKAEKEIGFLADTTDEAAVSQEELAKRAAAAAQAEKDAANAADLLAAAHKELATSANTAAAATDKAATKTKAAEKSSMSAGEAFGRFNSVLGSIGLGGFVGLELLNTIIKTIRENAERAAEAIKKVGGEQREFDLKVADIVDNLGLTPDDRGSKRARSAAINFMQQTGTNVEQAAQIMAGAQGAGFNVLDPNKPENDGTSQGFAVAAEVGKLSSRTRIDPATANQLMKILAGQGVKTADDARKVIAQMEAGQNATAITSPAEYLQSLVSIAAGRTDLQNSIKQLAAAAINTKSGEIAAQRVIQFRAVAAGSPSKLAAIGALAQQSGAVSQEQVDAAMPASDKADDFSARQDALKRNAAAADAEFRDRQAAITDRRAKLAAERGKPTRGRTDQASRLSDLARQESAIDRDEAAQKRERVKAIAERSAAAAKLSQDQADDLAKRRTVGAGAAYQQLSTEQQEAFITRLLAGKSPDEQKAIISRITEGSEGQQGVKAITSSAGVAAAADAAAKMRAATPAQVEQRNQTFLGGSATGREAVQGAATAKSLNEAGSGARMANEIAKLADTDIDLNRKYGLGGNSPLPFSTDLQERGRYALSDAQLKNQSTARITLARWQKFVTGMSPKLRKAIGEDKLTAFDSFLNRAYDQIVNDLNVGSQDLRATKMASALGEFIASVSSIASDTGETLPRSDVPVGKDLPLNLDRFDDSKRVYSSPGIIPPSEDKFLESQRSDPSGDTPPAPPTPAGVSPAASASPASTVIYNNVTIGTHVGANPGTWDFPGRLENL